MRTLTASLTEAIARRGIALERDAVLTLRRDAYATPPGPSVFLALGERTHYRPGAWLSDTFERPALGAAYPSWGGSAGLTLSAGAVQPVGVGAAGMVTHLWTVPRDPWATVQFVTLSGPSAVGGVLLRATDTDAYRITGTSAGQTVVESLVAGTPTVLTTVDTPWRAGDVLRVELVWTRLRVYREPILVAEVTVPAPTPENGFVGLVARRAVSGDAVSLGHFVAGEARQEYLGAGLDLGDVQRVVGQPATFELTLSNLAAMGGKDRFAALLRHGLNTHETFDLDRGDVKILTVLDGLSPPLMAGVGWIDGPSEVTEDRVRLACRGRDAFLTPYLAPGPVTYLPGPPPGGLTPIPADPCAPSLPPVVDPGPPPGEPPAETLIEGGGPDLPPQVPPVTPALLGAWLVEMIYTMDYGGGPGASNVYVGTTSVTQLTNRQVPLMTRSTIGAGTRAFPDEFREYLYYRGPDMTGLTLYPAPKSANPTVPADARVQMWGRPTSSGTGDFGIDIKLADYAAGGITSQAALAALRPKNPADTIDPMPMRVKTLREWHIDYTIHALDCSVDPHGDAAFLHVTHQATEFSAPMTSVFLERTTGPQLLRLEIANTAPAATQLFAELITGYTSTDPTGGFFGGTGPCGTGLHHFQSAPSISAFGPAWLQP